MLAKGTCYCVFCCCCCLQVEHKCRAAGPFCGEGERCLHKQIICGSTRKEGIRMTSHSPSLVFYNSNGQPTADDLLAFFLLSVNACKKIHFSVGLHVGPA